MKKTSAVLALVVAFVFSATLASASSSPPKPPGQPATGYGSPQKYICNTLFNGGPIDHHYCLDMGDTNAGTRYWVYIPSVLKNGTTAPVVVFLHGMFCLVPPIYSGHIKHLVRQGYIVIFPEYNLGGFSGMFNDMNQYDMLDRAIAAVNNALALPAVGSRAELNNIYLTGHSNGGNLGVSWAARGGVPLKSLTLMHPCTSLEAIPSFVRSLFMGNLVELDFRKMAAATTVPVILIGGSHEDNIARPKQLSDIYNALTNAPTKVYYQYRTDGYGDPDLQSDHAAPCQDDGVLPGWLIDLFGSMGITGFEEDAVDFRVHYAAVDAALDGKTRVTFDRGKWSDGRAVAPVQTLADSNVPAVSVFADCNFSGYMVQLPRGFYNLAALQARGINNDDLSSIKVPAGFKATLYKDDNYKGAAKVYTADQSCMVADGFNDVVSSIKIE